MPILHDWDEVIADVDEGARRESIDERRSRARMNHWCETCHGHTGPGSPCADDEPEPEQDSDQEDDECTAP